MIVGYKNTCKYVGKALQCKKNNEPCRYCENACPLKQKNKKLEEQIEL